MYHNTGMRPPHFCTTTNVLFCCKKQRTCILSSTMIWIIMNYLYILQAPRLLSDIQWVLHVYTPIIYILCGLWYRWVKPNAMNHPQLGFITTRWRGHRHRHLIQAIDPARERSFAPAIHCEWPLKMNCWLVVSNIVIFHNLWDNSSHWLIFFKMAKTTSHTGMFCISDMWVTMR